MVFTAGFMQGFRAHALVMGRRMMFRMVVSAVCTTAFPIHMKLVLPYLVPDPIIPHVHGLRSALFDAVVGDAACGAIVGDHRGGRLVVAKFTKGDTFGDGFFSVVEQSRELGFGDTGHSLT